MKVFIGFLLVSFVLGGRVTRRGRDRFAAMMALCIITAIALYSHRFA
jgi:hypothetical protein